MTAYEVHEKGGIYLITEPDAGPVISAFYALEGSPGVWRGHVSGRTRQRQVYMPDAEPLKVAAHFIRGDP